MSSYKKQNIGEKYTVTKLTRQPNSILGKGTYGCVIPKILICDKRSDELIKKGITNVSKLLLNKGDFDKEVNNTLFINKYDNGKTCIKIDDTCIITKEKIKEILDTNGIDKIFLDKCDISFENNKIYQIIFNKKGITLYDVMSKNDKMPLNKFIKLTFNLFKGIKLFNKLNFIHFDIKSDNIMYLPDEDKFIFIDFGLSKTYKILLKNRSLEYYSSSPRYYYPPEFIAFSDFFKKDKYDYNTLFKLFKYKYETELIDHNDYTIINNMVLYNYDNNYSTYLNELKKLFDLYYYTDDPYNILKESLNKIDIYSLGITLYRCINKYNINNRYVINIYKYIIFPCIIINPTNRISINKLLYLYGKNIL